MSKRAVFFGRWQPCHLGHEWLIRQKLDKGVPCLVYVRDIPPGPGNPYTTEETVDILRAAFKGEDVIVLAHPDIESVNWGRGVGYQVNDHGECPVISVSATRIRKSLENNDGEWEQFVSPKVAVKLRQIHGL